MNTDRTNNFKIIDNAIKSGKIIKAIDFNDPIRRLSTLAHSLLDILANIDIDDAYVEDTDPNITLKNFDINKIADDTDDNFKKALNNNLKSYIYNNAHRKGNNSPTRRCDENQSILKNVLLIDDTFLNNYYNGDPVNLTKIKFDEYGHYKTIENSGQFTMGNLAITNVEYLDRYNYFSGVLSQVIVNSDDSNRKTITGKILPLINYGTNDMNKASSAIYNTRLQNSSGNLSVDLIDDVDGILIHYNGYQDEIEFTNKFYKDLFIGYDGSIFSRTYNNDLDNNVKWKLCNGNLEEVNVYIHAGRDGSNSSFSLSFSYIKYKNDYGKVPFDGVNENSTLTEDSLDKEILAPMKSIFHNNIHSSMKAEGEYYNGDHKYIIRQIALTDENVVTLFCDYYRNQKFAVESQSESTELGYYYKKYVPMGSANLNLVTALSLCNKITRKNISNRLV